MPGIITCLHATRRAVEPAQRMLSELPETFRCEDLVEERLLDCADDESAAFPLFVELLKQAEARGPRAILTTCSMYTPLLPAAREHVDTPIIGVDEAMIGRAARLGGSLALVGSLAAAIETTERQILARGEQLEGEARIAARHQAPVDACESPAGLRCLCGELRTLLRRAETVVVVQLSLTPAVDLLFADERERMLTPPPFALAELRRITGNESRTLKTNETCLHDRHP